MVEKLSETLIRRPILTSLEVARNGVALVGISCVGVGRLHNERLRYMWMDGIVLAAFRGQKPCLVEHQLMKLLPQDQRVETGDRVTAALAYHNQSRSI